MPTVAKRGLRNRKLPGELTVAGLERKLGITLQCRHYSFVSLFQFNRTSIHIFQEGVTLFVIAEFPYALNSIRINADVSTAVVNVELDESHAFKAETETILCDTLFARARI